MTDLELRKTWYARTDVQANIVPCLQARETAFLVPHSLKQASGSYPVRCIKAHTSSYLLRNMGAYTFFERQYNLYHSIYTLQDMPMFSFQPLKRHEQQAGFFKHYDDYVTGVDFVMDFDGDKKLQIEDRIENARRITVKVCAILSHYGVPYNVVFSGSKGFHVEVRGFPPTRNWREQISEFERVAVRLVLVANGEENRTYDENVQEYLLNRFSFDSSIYNVTRIWKCPYSYDTSTDCVVMPLDDEEIRNFNIADYHVSKQMKKFFMQKRGDAWGPIGLKARPGTIENFWIMAKTIGHESW